MGRIDYLFNQSVNRDLASLTARDLLCSDANIDEVVLKRNNSGGYDIYSHLRSDIAIIPPRVSRFYVVEGIEVLATLNREVCADDPEISVIRPFSDSFVFQVFPSIGEPYDISVSHPGAIVPFRDLSKK